MDIAELVLKYIDVIVWPVVVIVIVAIFRRRLRELLGRLKQAEGAGFKAQFAELRQAASHEPPAPAVVEVQGQLTFDADATAEVELKPVRQPYIKFKVRSLVDAVNVPTIFKSHDKVVLDVSEMEKSTRLMVGTFIFGYSMADLEMVVDDAIDSDDLKVTLTHASDADSS